MDLKQTELPRMQPVDATMTPKFVLLTGTAPAEPGVGGVILRNLVEVAGFENCRCCWLAPKYDRGKPYLPDLETLVEVRRYETAFRPIRGLAGELISAVAMRAMRPRMIRKASSTVERLVQSFQPQYVLLVLESPAAIEVGLDIHKRTRIPLRTIVWDDVDLFCRQGMFDRWTRNRVEKSFQQVLQSSERVAVISENMRSAYKREHGVESMVLRHGVSSSANVDVGLRVPQRDVEYIGFAGSNTAPDCLNALVQALDEANWCFNGREVVLRLLGVRYLLDSRKPQRIEYFGWRSVEETRDRLAECNLLYLPQTFSSDSRRFSELSFPTKLSTYVAARRPIFLHAPDYASLAAFWQQFELGPTCQELAPSRILEALKDGLSGHPQRNATWQNEISHVQDQILNPKRFEEAVRQLLD